MNRYEEKLEARRERLLARAQKHRSISEASFNRVHRIADMIPLGQPILVGHHSERHARKDQERIHNGMRKGIDEADYAKDLQRRADAVGSAGISSDDPEAVVKLKEELAKAEKVHAMMKAANIIIHRKPKNEWTAEKETELITLGLKQVQAVELFKPDFCGRIGFPDYAMTNNGSNIRRIKGRIEELSKHENREEKETNYIIKSRCKGCYQVVAINLPPDGHTNEHALPCGPVEVETLIVRENPDINRIQLIFDKKPDEATRKLCKSQGFHWSPYETAWQRHLNNSGIWAAKWVVEQLMKK